MSINHEFKGYFVNYNCPLCKKAKSLDGTGQSMLWIALKCVAKGMVLSPCDSCGQLFRIPAEIFAEGILRDFDEVAHRPGDQLHEYVLAKYVKTKTQAHILRPDWYDILLKANATGPVNAMALPWDPRDDCPLCNKGPHHYSIGFSYACPNCKHEIGIAQDDIDPKLGVQVLCRDCMKTHIVPSSVWCPKCKRALIYYYNILRHIADANGVSLDQLRLRK